MGIYDRDYYQDENAARGFHGSGPKTVVTKIVLVTVAIYVVDLLFSGRIAEPLQLYANFYQKPWTAYQLLTYGLVHAANPLHVGMNMFVLWMFGRPVEQRLGGREFLVFYLAAILFAGCVWVAWCNLVPGPHGLAVRGASGGVVAVFLLFVLYYPRQTVYLLGVFAMPAWVVGAIVVGQDVLRGLIGAQDVTAWQAHLGGAAFAYLYLKSGIQLGRFVPQGFRLPKNQPKLRIHDPEADEENLAREADAVLDKLHREGEESLTRRERRILEKYSRSVRGRRDQ